MAVGLLRTLVKDAVVTFKRTVLMFAMFCAVFSSAFAQVPPPPGGVGEDPWATRASARTQAHAWKDDVAAHLFTNAEMIEFGDDLVADIHTNIHNCEAVAAGLTGAELATFSASLAAIQARFDTEDARHLNATALYGFADYHYNQTVTSLDWIDAQPDGPSVIGWYQGLDGQYFAGAKATAINSMNIEQDVLCLLASINSDLELLLNGGGVGGPNP